MPMKWVTRLGLLTGASVMWAIFAYVFCKTTMAVGAQGVTDSGWVAQAFSLLSASGLSVATVVAFLKNWAPTVIHAVAPNVQLPDLDSAKAKKEIGDLVELGEATLAYLAKRNDKAAQRRFAIAAVTELSDVAELKSPEISQAISALGDAMAKRWWPQPTVEPAQ